MLRGMLFVYPVIAVYLKINEVRLNMRNIYKNFLATFVAVLISIAAVPSFAMHDEVHEHVTPSVNTQNDADVVVQPNEAIIVVHGIVCSFCSQGVTKKLSKLSFIDPSKYTKGIKVEIKDQKVTIAIKPGKEADFQTIFAAIKSGGYEPVKAYTSDGSIITPEDK